MPQSLCLLVEWDTPVFHKYPRSNPQSLTEDSLQYVWSKKRFLYKYIPMDSKWPENMLLNTSWRKNFEIEHLTFSQISPTKMNKLCLQVSSSLSFHLLSGVLLYHKSKLGCISLQQSREISLSPTMWNFRESVTANMTKASMSISNRRVTQ